MMSEKKKSDWEDSCTLSQGGVGNLHLQHYVQHSLKLSECRRLILEVQDSHHKDSLHSLRSERMVINCINVISTIWLSWNHLSYMEKVLVVCMNGTAVVVVMDFVISFD